MNNHANEARPGREAVVIPPDKHPVREQDIDEDALAVLHRLKDAGYAGYLVGGGVRDLYLGKQPKDFDISTNAHPGQLRKLFRNSRTIGRRFRLVQVFFRDNKIIEVSTLRSQSEYDEEGEPEQVLPANNTFGTLEEDAFRRDLTINSLFYEVENKTVIDYVGGVQDLADGIIRIIGDPDRRIVRDPVRMLRAVRHAARAGFAIEEATRQAIVRHRDKIDLCPTSRIRDELLKDLQGGKSRVWAELAVETGIFSALFPFYEELMAGTEGAKVKEEVLALLGVLDRIFQEGSQIGKVALDDALLFGLLLFPWAQRRFGLLRQEPKGAGHQRLVQAVRDGLDEAFSRRLNLAKMTLDSIATLFVNSPVFQECARKNAWPAWLRKKSYFAECSRFAACCGEAEGGGAIDVAQFATPIVERRPFRDREPKKKTFESAAVVADSGSRGGGGSNPAFSRREGGVFGLRMEGKGMGPATQEKELEAAACL